MEFFQQLDQTSGVNYISNNNMKLVHNKKRLTEEQVGVLERSFRTNKKLEPELKHHLANKLGVPPRQVAIWYQNKRARWKTQNLEVGYSALQLQFENVTADKKRLERQLKHLQEELQKAQDMLFTLTSSNNDQEAGGGGGGGGGGRFNHADSSSHELLVDDGNDDELFHLCMFDFCK